MLVIFCLVVSGIGLTRSNWFQTYSINQILKSINGFQGLTVNFEHAEIKVLGASKIYGLTLINHSDTLLHAKQADFDYNALSSDSSYISMDKIALLDGFINLDYLPVSNDSVKSEIIFNTDEIEIIDFEIIKQNHHSKIENLKTDFKIDLANNHIDIRHLQVKDALLDIPQNKESDPLAFDLPFYLRIENTQLEKISVPSISRLNLENGTFKEIKLNKKDLGVHVNTLIGTYQDNKAFELLDTYFEMSQKEFQLQLKLKRLIDMDLELNLKAQYNSLHDLVALDSSVQLKGEVKRLLFPAQKLGLQEISQDSFLASSCIINGNATNLDLMDFKFENKNIRGNIVAHLSPLDSTFEIIINNLEYLHPKKIRDRKLYLRLNHSKIYFKDSLLDGKIRGSLGNLSFECNNFRYNINNQVARSSVVYQYKDTTNLIEGKIQLNAKKNDLLVDHHIKFIATKNQYFESINQKISIKDSMLFTQISSLEKDNHFNLNGHVDLSTLVFNINAKVYNIGLDKISNRKYIGTNLKLNGQFNDLDQHHLTLILDSLISRNNQDTLIIDSIVLSSISNQSKSISLESNFMNAKLQGEFVWNELPLFVHKISNKIFPSSIKKKTHQLFNSKHVSFALEVKDSISPLNIFYPKLHIEVPTHIESSIDVGKDSLWLAATTTGLKFDDFKMDTTVTFINVSDHIMHLGFHTKAFWLLDTIGLCNVELLTESIQDTINSKIIIHPNSLKRPFVLHLNTILGDKKYHINLLNKTININDNTWVITADESILNYENEQYQFNNITLRNDTQSLSILGGATNQIQIQYNQLQLNDFLSLVNYSSQNIIAQINGKTAIDIKQSSIKSNLELANICLSDQCFEEGTIQINKNEKQQPLFIEGKFTNNNEGLLVKGLIPAAQDQFSDINMVLNNINASRIETFTSPTINNIQGKLNGIFTLKTDNDELKLSGNINSNDLAFNVPLLQTKYNCNDSIFFVNDRILFKKMIIKDINNQTATINGEIQLHKSGVNFEKIRIFPSDSFLLMNTKEIHQPEFYARILAKEQFLKNDQRSYIEIDGNPSSLNIIIKSALQKGTKLTIPIEAAEDISNGQFIRFEDLNTQNSTFPSQRQIDSSYQLNCYTEITPQDSIEILLKSSAGTDILTCLGQGNIRTETNPNGDFEIYGVYEVNKGSYIFHFRDFLKKKYIINAGSSIGWNGDPYKANLDIEAVYRLRTNIADLLAFSRGSEELSNQKIRTPVQLFIQIKGALEAPEISFRIQIDDAKYANELRPLMAKIHNDPSELNKHVFTLLFINRFAPVFENSGANRPNLIFSNMGEFFNQQIGNILKQTSSEFLKSMDLDVGLDAHSIGETNDLNDDGTQKELKLALSKSLFNDRVIVDIGGNYYFGADDIDNELAGDFGIEYVITKDRRLRAKVFNKSETDPLIRQNIYKRGVSLNYKREFDHINELWKRFFHKSKPLNSN